MSIHPRRVEAKFPGYVYDSAPRNVYWEMTQACDLDCQHCRASAQPLRHPGELSTEEGKALIDNVKELGSMLIFTGGDPMKRADLFELMQYARDSHVPIAITPSTTPTLTEEVVVRFAAIGISALGVSLDGPTAEVHDAFRKVSGTFERSQQALRWAREHDIPVQINTTVTTFTLPHLPEMFRLLCERHAPPVKRWSLGVRPRQGCAVSRRHRRGAALPPLLDRATARRRDEPERIGQARGAHGLRRTRR